MPKIGNIQLPEFPLLLAPMEDVSDPPFRAVCKDNGADLMYSEFISSEGLIRDAIKSLKKLDFSEEERPFGIQIFGGDEEAMAMSARICETVNPDLVDINFGCPVKKVVSKGAGAGVLKDIDLIELNEAFASQSLAVIRELDLNPEIVNVNGGAIALGHPLGCTGAKLSVQLFDEMKLRGSKYGIVSMCVGTGQGSAGVFELL